MTFDYNKYAQSGDYAKFNDQGDQVVGIIKEVREGKDFNGNPCPELVLEVDEDGNELTVTAGQVMLKAALAEKAPSVGDKIRITYSGVGESKPGKAPPKLFTVDVKEGPHELAEPAVVNVADDAPF
jgi:hypothetical protein